MQETQEMQVWSLGQEDPLEEQMATHSNILARKNSWTEEPGWLQFMEELDMTEWLSMGAHSMKLEIKCGKKSGKTNKQTWRLNKTQ